MDGQSQVVSNGMKLVGEFILPGASQMLEGKVGNGLLHSAAAYAAPLLLGGPIGGLLALAVRLNSYSSSVTDRNLWDMASSSVADSVNRRAPSSGPAASKTS